MTVSYWLEAHTPKQELEVDVAIIGGGIMGATAAYWLSQRKGLKTIVLESQKPGWGASGRNGGLVLRGTDAYYNQSVSAYGRETARAIFEFNQDTHLHLSKFVEKYGNDFFYDQCGSYLLACSLDELNHLEESAELMHQDGFEVEYLKYDPLERDYYGALYNACDIGVHSGLLVESVVRASGVTVYNNEQVYRLESLSDGKTLVYSNGMRVKADRVLLLANAYSALLEPWLVDKMFPMRGQVMVTKPLKKRILSNLCYANYGFEYFRQLPDDRFLIGGCREAFVDEEITFTDTTTLNIQTALHNYVRDRFPEVAGVPVDFRWAGTMSFTKDGLPIIGELIQQSVIAGTPATQMPGVFYCVGCNGHGMGWSFALSKLIVEMALDGASPRFFGIDRLNQKSKQAV